MFFGQMERELLWEAMYSTSQNQKLPENLQLQVDRVQGKLDLWEYQSQDIQEAVRQENMKTQNK